jgi:type VI secretion system secreted protein VgrG
MAQIQTARPFNISTPLGDDVLLFYRMTATEELGRLFRFELDLLSREPDIAFDDILGQNVTVRLTLADDQKRYFNGFVSRFSQEGFLDEFHVYSATVHPWLWFLTRTADCRIFQEETVPNIVKTVFKDHGFSDYEESLSGNYRKWEYCVQYRETDFNFVSRLMEQEGIYYYFKHDKDKHTMVLSDSVSSHEPYPGFETLPFFPPDEHLRREQDHIYEWTPTWEIQPGAYALNDFDFTRPKANMQVKSSIQRDHAHGAMEIYDYPGEYPDTDDGESYARARIEELQANQELVQAQSNALGLAAGSLFELTDYPREDQNREYLITSATHQMESEAYSSGSSAGSSSGYTCNVTALPSRQPYRPARITPKPMVQGPQTAIVVGPSGDEIHTDKYGRVKVSFHWDRYSKSNETSSCWVRVAQIWAGKQWGGIHIPRIGQEVIVDFLEGDPDHPIITGRVYNNDNMPPYELPANATQSGIKSRSSKGGGTENFNEIRFEDKKGEEEIYLHGEKDWNIIIENNKTQSIGNDESLSVGNDRIKSVGRNQEESIEENKKITVGGNHEETVSGNAKIKVKKGKEITVGESMTLDIDKSLSAHVGKDLSENIDKNMTSIVGDNLSIDIGKDHTTKVGKNMDFNVSENAKLSIKKDLSLIVTKKTTIKSDDELILKCGKANIIMKKNGDIQIKGKKINIKGTGDVIIKGSKIGEN